MKDRELMQEVLEAMESLHRTGDTQVFDMCAAPVLIPVLRERLAQPEQEPVATLDDLEQEIYENTRQFVSRDVMEWMLKRYYTTPPQRKPLTDEEIYKIANDLFYGNGPCDTLAMCRAIEAAHGIEE